MSETLSDKTLNHDAMRTNFGNRSRPEACPYWLDIKLSIEHRMRDFGE